MKILLLLKETEGKRSKFSINFQYCQYLNAILCEKFSMCLKIASDNGKFLVKIRPWMISEELHIRLLKGDY